ncbi:MAG: heterodisulfide reductase-related iron-sulfur binding cluster, partial [Planctomycetota bacterium]
DADYAEELDFCLVCRNCESACPSGVQFGTLMESARDGLEVLRPRGPLARLARFVGFRGILQRRFALSVSAFGLRFLQRTGLLRVAALLGERGRALAAQPAVPPLRERRALPASTPSSTQRRGAVALLQGCVMPEWLGRVNRSTVRVLGAAGFDTNVPTKHVCCGALHAHNGDREGARTLLKKTIELFEALPSGDSLPLVVNSAGCGAHLREAEHFFEGEPEWEKRAAALAARVRDLSEFLTEQEASLPLKQSKDVALPLTYDDPCHLCHGQGIRTPPREWLDRIEGSNRVELADSESCCGSAGIYSILRPADAQAILEPKLDALERSGAKTLVTANPGCQLQWQTGVQKAQLDVEVLHLAELLDRSLGAGVERNESFE